MKTLAFAIASLLLLQTVSVWAVTGYSVTILWRYTSNGNPPVPEMNLPDIGGNETMPVGQLARLSIVNNAVTRTDTIIKMTTAFCQYPAWSIDGSKIAFFRWPYRVVNGASAKIAGDNACISIVDANGKNRKDLLSFAVLPGVESALDWSADGWIYYAKPRTDVGDRLGRSGCEVWKINACAGNPASTNVKVLSVESCKYIRRFSISQAGDRCAIQTYPVPGMSCGGDINGAGPVPNGGAFSMSYGQGGSCNAKISAGGTIMGGYAGGAHAEVQLSHFDGQRFTESGWPLQPWCIDHTSIFKAFTWAGFDMSGSAGCEMLIFASNSDKWYSENVMWQYGGARRGTNQLILNWHDMQALFGTRNPYASGTGGDPGPGQIGYQASTGDFWVMAPAGYDYAYQDTAGAWHQMTKPSGWVRGDTAINSVTARGIGFASAAGSDRLTIRDLRGGGLAIDLPDQARYRISIIDMRGRTAFARSAQANLSIEPGTLKAGRYLVNASRQEQVRSGSFVLEQ